MPTTTAAAPPVRRPTLVRPLRRSDAGRCLVCLPFCGGGTGSYRAWAQAIDDDTDLALVCYPGREARFAEPFADTWDELAADVTACVLLAADRPYTLFGHSMGGWMAFEVATRIERAGGPAPDAVVVSACNAPFRGVTEQDRFPRQEDSDGRMLDWMRQAGALPDYALADPELSAIAVDLMRADVRIRDTYVPVPRRKLRELSAEDVDRWLTDKARELSTSTVSRIKSILSRSITRAQARDKVKRNVVLLCGTPTGLAGRPSQALTFDQAQALLDAAPATTMGAYVVVSLLTGARTEELRALTWEHVDLAGDPVASPPVPPNVRVWRSVRAGGDTKTRGSRRTLALPERCVEALEEHRDRQRVARAVVGERWTDRDLVFATEAGTAMDAANVRRDFQRVAVAAGLDDRRWSPRELRHSFVSLLSDRGVPIEEIARLIGHTGGSKVTESVYRKQLRPVIEAGATAMNRVFPGRRRDSHPVSHPVHPGTPRRPGQDPPLGR